MNSIIGVNSLVPTSLDEVSLIWYKVDGRNALIKISLFLSVSIAFSHKLWLSFRIQTDVLVIGALTSTKTENEIVAE
jgi:hypothetical protein